MSNATKATSLISTNKLPGNDILWMLIFCVDVNPCNSEVKCGQKKQTREELGQYGIDNEGCLECLLRQDPGLGEAGSEGH